MKLFVNNVIILAKVVMDILNLIVCRVSKIHRCLGLNKFCKMGVVNVY